MNEQEYRKGSREEFLSKLKSGEYDGVEAIYRSNESTSISGKFDKELVELLPKTVKYICHNGPSILFIASPKQGQH